MVAPNPSEGVGAFTAMGGSANADGTDKALRYLTPKHPEASSGCAVQLLDDLTSGRFRHFTSDDLSHPCVPRGATAITVGSLRDRAEVAAPSMEEMPVGRVGSDEGGIGQHSSQQRVLASSGQLDDLLDVAKTFIGRHRVQGLCHPCSQFEGFVLFSPCCRAVAGIDAALFPAGFLGRRFATALRAERLVAAEGKLTVAVWAE